MVKTIKAGFCIENDIIHDTPSADLSLSPELPFRVKTVRARAKGVLVPGPHALALSDRAARIDVVEGTTIDVELMCAVSPQERLALRKLAIAFNHPIRLKNVFTTLDEMSVLIADSDEDNEILQKIRSSEILNKAGDFLEKRAAEIKNSEGIKKAEALWRKTSMPYLEKIANSKGWKTLVNAAEKTSEKAAEISPVVIEKSKDFLNKALEFGEETIDKAIDGLDVLSLEITSDASDVSDKKKHIAMRFSGNGILSEKIQIPLNDVEFPGFFLNRFAPELSELLAQFCVTSAQGTSLSKTFLGMIEKIDGDYKTSFELEKMELAVSTRGNRQTRLGLGTDRDCSVSGTFEIRREKENLSARLAGNVACDDIKMFGYKGTFETTEDALIACGEQLERHAWTLSMNGEGRDIRGAFELDEGTRGLIDSIHLNVHDPELKFDVQVPLNLKDVHVDGSVCFGISAENSAVYVHTQNINLSGRAAWNESFALDIVKSHTTFSPCKGAFYLNCQKDDAGILRFSLNSGLDVTLKNVVRIEPIPELQISDSVQTDVSGRFDVSVSASIDTRDVSYFVMDCSHSSIRCQIHRAGMRSGIYCVDTDKTFCVNMELVEGAITPDGFADSTFRVDWRAEQAPLLHVNARETAILLPELMNSRLTVHVSEQGSMSFDDGKGFFDEHFFNMLFHPDHEKEKMMSLLSYEPALQLGESVIRTMSDVTGPIPGMLIDRLKRCVALCAEKGIQIDLNHLVCMRDLAHIVSLFCFESLEDAPAIEVILRDAVGARGVDRHKTEELLERAFPDIDFTQLSPALRILDKIFKGVTFVSPGENSLESLYDEYAHRNRLLPSANQLFDYATTSPEVYRKNYKYGGPCLIDTPATRARIFKYAAGYTIRQIEWILSHHGDLFTDEQRLKLEHLVAIKRRIQNQEPREGSFLVQDFNIDYFLPGLLDAEEEVLPHVSDLTGCLDDFTERCVSDDVVECFATWLTPADIGRLLSAGVASRIQSQLVQLNQARLLNYLVRRGRMFSLAAFYEAGACSDRILTSLLMSVLTQDQSLLKEPVDRAKLLSELLDIEFPVREEYLSGGAHASESYFERLHEIAHQINGSVESYVAAKLRMQSDRIATDEFVNEETPKRPPYEPVFSDEDELAELARALEKADNAGREIVIETMSAIEDGTFEPQIDENAVRRVEKAYKYAYRLASAVLNKYPDTIEKDVFSRFYARTYRALMVQVLDQNLIDDTDVVRRWFAVRSGIAESEIASVSRCRRRHAIIDVLFYCEADRQELRRDPIVWIDTRPADGFVDLTVLAAMGVITDGKRGVELHTSFERLKKTRNIDLIRADTGNVKSLAYNSSIIENEIRKLNKPFMLLGYSQGCANMMRAESNLYTSTPDDRACLNNLKARHFLYSALNGSAHAYCGGEIYRRTMIDGEKYLKTVSATKSTAMSDFLFEILRKFLDSPVITMSLNSIESLSYIGLEQLSRDAQYTPGVLSTELQGVCTEYIPEALEYMKFHFDAQAEGESDTQVGEDCSHSYHVYNHNDSVDLLRRESIGAATLKAHHWYPLYETVAFIETEKDIRDAVYHAPADIHIVPAIEALILFGKIRYTA